MAQHTHVKSRRKRLAPLFHLQTEKEDDSQVTTSMVNLVRKSGQLNLSGRNLLTVPARVFTMYETNGAEAIVNYDLSKSLDDAWWSFSPLTYIDLSSNVLCELPKDIRMFEDLATLNLQHNNLTVLPPEIGTLTKLTKLNLSHNKINILPKEFYKLVELQHLILSYNCLEVLTVDIGDLVMLQQLDLSYNNITSLPPGIGYLVRLTELNLSHNKLIDLPPDIVNLRVLLKLDVTHNDLKFLPKLGELRKLQCLYAQHNDIEELPDFEGCENIQELHLGNNFIKEVPKEFCETMSHVKIVDLRDNKIESLPNEISMLHHVVRMDLTNNGLITLPDTLGFLPHLQNLQLEGNILKQIRCDIIKGGTSRILKHLREKYNAENSGGDIPEALDKTSGIDTRNFPDKYAMRNSRALSLTMQELTVVPREVFEDAERAEVTIVDLCRNKLVEVPSGLQLIACNITELNLSNNVLKSIPEFISECVKLQYLDIGSNFLADMPCMQCLNHLRELVISNNRFTNIPESIYDLESLEILLASGNQITDIDVSGLKRLRRIATLDLANNNISYVPPELGNMKQLRCLELKGNSFRQPRYAIIEQGTDTILSYLRDRIPQ